jgi:hypothetical protein
MISLWPLPLVRWAICIYNGYLLLLFGPSTDPEKTGIQLRLLLLKKKLNLNLFHSLRLVYKSMRGMMTNSIDRDQWLNVTSESRDRI